MVNGYQYGCASSRNRGEAACANALRVPRQRVETRLLDAIVHGLFGAEEVARFQDALRQRLASAADLEAERRALIDRQRRIDRETKNLVQAIKEGIAVQMVRDELDRCERQRLETERRLAALDHADSAGASVPAKLDGYAAALAGLRRLAQQDVLAARQQLGGLVGEIRLLPYEGHLVAWLTGDLFGLLGLTVDSDLVLWREERTELLGGLGRFVKDELVGFRTGRQPRTDEDPDDSKTPPSGSDDGVSKQMLVAGAGFEPATFRL